MREIIGLLIFYVKRQKNNHFFNFFFMRVVLKLFKNNLLTNDWKSPINRTLK